MKILTVLFALLFIVALFLVANGIAMLLIAGVGHVFNIVTFQYISFWETAILALIFGFLGYGAAR